MKYSSRHIQWNVTLIEIPDYKDGNPWTFPCVYFLLTHKDEELYDEALRVLAGLRDFIMTDFERGLLNSLSSVFLSSTMDGCLFHFWQATLNWVRKNGLKKTYEEGERDPVTGRYNPSNSASGSEDIILRNAT